MSRYWIGFRPPDFPALMVPRFEVPDERGDAAGFLPPPFVHRAALVARLRRRGGDEDARPPFLVFAVGDERDVLRLESVADRALHQRLENPVHFAGDPRHGAEVDGELEHGALARDRRADFAVQVEVGAAEAVDGLLRVADDEEFSGDKVDCFPIAGVLVGALAEEEDDLGLERVGVLELVHEDEAEVALEVVARGAVVAEHVARFDEQVDEVQRAAPVLGLAVAVEERAEPLGEIAEHAVGDFAGELRDVLLHARAAGLRGLKDLRRGPVALLSGLDLDGRRGGEPRADGVERLRIADCGLRSQRLLRRAPPLLSLRTLHSALRNANPPRFRAPRSARRTGRSPA